MPLFRLLAVAMLVVASAALAQKVDSPPVVNLENVKWESNPELPGCMQMAVSQGDPASGPVTVALRATRDCSVTWHWHSANESTAMVRGTFKLEMHNQGTFLMKAGGFSFISGKQRHREVCLTAVCIAYVTLDGPVDVHHVDAAGKEISLEEGLQRSGKAGKF
jgi:anti-sigma factor ChrR (cupin superfamily)